VNTYTASNVRVEEGQKVISTGVYGFVRHPMYVAALFLFIGTPLALGSWWTSLLFPVFMPILVARILNEEKVLMRDLPGYIEYTQGPMPIDSRRLVKRRRPPARDCRYRAARRGESGASMGAVRFNPATAPYGQNRNDGRTVGAIAPAQVYGVE
jgi:hypothetical protein